jgi:hypothetical protein
LLRRDNQDETSATINVRKPGHRSGAVGRA